MRARKSAISVLVLALAVCCGGLVGGASAAEESYAGVWKGTWEGAGGTGSYDITLERGSDGKLTGSVAEGSDAVGNYTAKFSSVAFSGNQLTAVYAFPPDATQEVTLTGKFDATTASGTWSLAPKGQPAQAMASGTFTVSRK